eukprot:TRINITY_DN103645_c0_g1_i1.p1 TRINITY_DN103645_c0_g1~~TRINITY_DN103645_c0_g1_i1.p1  ORF type:complete len:609 (-),score=102.96 TRINITY_DN103645_c0_g1_i1:19-1845(-)
MNWAVSASAPCVRSVTTCNGLATPVRHSSALGKYVTPPLDLSVAPELLQPSSLDGTVSLGSRSEGASTASQPRLGQAAAGLSASATLVGLLCAARRRKRPIASRRPVAVFRHYSEKDETPLDPKSADFDQLDISFEEGRGEGVVGRDAGICVDEQMDPKKARFWKDELDLLKVDVQRLLECVYPPTANVAFGCVLCDASKMTLINFQATGNKKATDVLSFQDMGPDGPLIGEVWINVELVESEAEKRGYDPIDEFRILMTHGILHLAGHDHERGPDALLLHAAEEQWILNRLGWQGSGLIERVDSPELAEKAVPSDDPKTPWERLPGNVRDAAFKDVSDRRFVQIKDEEMDGKTPDEIMQTLDEDKAKFLAEMAELEKQIDCIDVAGMPFRFRPYHHLQFSGCGGIYGGSYILSTWFLARNAQLPSSGDRPKVLEISSGCIGLIGATLAKNFNSEVVWTDRQAAAMIPLQTNLGLNDVTDPCVERYDYIRDDCDEWAKGRKFDVIVFSADAILFKVDDSEARGKVKNEPDRGITMMIDALKSLLAPGGRIMVGVGEYHELIPHFFQEARDTYGFRVTRVGDNEGRPVQDARFPTDKEFGVVRMIPPRS